jgi:hypothetical protein
LAAALSVAGLAAGAGAADALWSQSQTVPAVDVAYGQVGFAVERIGADGGRLTAEDGPDLDSDRDAQSWESGHEDLPDAPGSVSVGAALTGALLGGDAQALADPNLDGGPDETYPNQIHIPYSVSSLAEGHSRLVYEISVTGWTKDEDGVPAWSPGVTAHSRVVLAPVVEAGECVPGLDLSGAVLDHAYGDPGEASVEVAGAGFADQGVVGQVWCLVLTYSGPEPPVPHDAPATADSVDPADQLSLWFVPRVSRWDL